MEITYTTYDKSMAVERRVMFGINDVKSLAFECVHCSARIYFLPEGEIEIPKQCPECRKEWTGRTSGKPDEILPSPFIGLTEATMRMKRLAAEGSESRFRIRFEFDEPR